MPRAKIWLDVVQHMDRRLVLRVGNEVALPVSYLGGRLMVNAWGGTTLVRGRLVGIEFHEVSEDGDGPGMMVEDTDDFQHEADDYVYELTVATNDWLPHA